MRENERVWERGRKRKGREEGRKKRKNEEDGEEVLLAIR